MAKKARRTTHRSTAGKKLYAVRDSKGRIKDIQTYERAHGADVARTSAAEVKAKAKARPRRREEEGRQETLDSARFHDRAPQSPNGRGMMKAGSGLIRCSRIAPVAPRIGWFATLVGMVRLRQVEPLPRR